MSELPDAGSPSLEAVRALERELSDQGARSATDEATLTAARDQAERLREAARARGAADAEDRRRLMLEQADREAARVRAEAERQAERLSAAMRVQLPETVAALGSLVVPRVEEP